MSNSFQVYGEVTTQPSGNEGALFFVIDHQGIEFRVKASYAARAVAETLSIGDKAIFDGKLLLDKGKAPLLDVVRGIYPTSASPAAPVVAKEPVAAGKSNGKGSKEIRKGYEALDSAGGFDDSDIPF
jgi:hypothetical protein